MEPEKTYSQPTPPAPTGSGSFGPYLPPTKQSDNEGLKSILSTIAILIAAPIVALFLTAFVFQSYEVDGPSMETTLQNHDRLLVSKVQRTFAKITRSDYIPKRGDIIIFNTSAIHDGENDAGNKQLIKRVIGLPGDRVVVKDGSVTIYNKQYPEGFNPDKTGDWGEVIQITPGSADIMVKDSEVFVMGDNRTNSLDSRVIGTIPSKDIIGKLIFRIYPLNNAEVF